MTVAAGVAAGAFAVFLMVLAARAVATESAPPIVRRGPRRAQAVRILDVLAGVAALVLLVGLVVVVVQTLV
ncbi:hypothetical protein [Actinomycetospora atypica]|uniref:Uncharacterized protein n=1 Tax=Actinomycetospora atypica TaxID=1290095 RepID=A0ABV9YHT2_9PSEU